MALLLAGTSRCSREIGPKWWETNYRKIERMIPMRDGVKLYTAIYLPKDNDNHPVLMMRTPYGLNPYGKGFHKYLRTAHGPYVQNRYILVYQNVRGTYMSEGKWEQVRPVGLGGADDATDAYDTAEWIINNLPTNGNIGVSGVSYNGFYASLAAVSKHPAIKAVSPQAPVTDWFAGDDAHTNGAFQNGMFLFAASLMQERKGPSWRSPIPVIEAKGDYYDWFISKKSISGLINPFKDRISFLKEMTEHPSYDEFWAQRNPTSHFRDISAAVLVVGGWFDGEDCYGTFETYRKMCENSPQTETYLVAGPWYHGGWNKLGFENLGDAWFGKGISRYYLEKIEYPFFAYYLEGKGEKPKYKAKVLASAETMKPVMENTDPNGQWMELDAWPPREAQSYKLYLNENESLTAEPPQKEWSATYVSDPKHPVPFMENTENGFDREFMVADQRFAVRRTDVLVFGTDSLKKELHLAGPLRARLKVSMDVSDADLIVKLVDVRPDGKHILIRHGIMPARFRDGLSEPKPMLPGVQTDIVVEMNDINHIFLPGHRLELLVMSSKYPLVAMNPQTYLENPYKAEAEDYRKANITIHSGVLEVIAY